MTDTANLRAAAYDAANYIAYIRNNDGIDDGECAQPLKALRRALRGSDEPYILRAAVRALMTAGGEDWRAHADLLARTAEDAQTKRVDEIARNVVDRDVFANVGNVVEHLLGRFGEDDCPFNDDEYQGLSFSEPGVDEYREGLPTYKGSALYAVVQGIGPYSGAQAWFWHAVDTDEPNDGAPSADDADWFGTELEALKDLYEEEDLDVPDGCSVFEHWLVSSYLAEHLTAHGESVVSTDMFHQSIWGRCTTGQAIYMDGVIQRIALGILEAGQTDFSDDDDDRVAGALILLADIQPHVEAGAWQAEVVRIMADLGADRLKSSFAVACEVRFGFDPRDTL